MSILSNLQNIWKELPPGIKLVAVSKFHPSGMILEAYSAGQRIFGESKVQELTEKYEVLPKAIEWHFIGHLQTNKVKYIVPFIDTIHSVDSLKLLVEIDKYAAACNRKINILLQIHIAEEESKFGLSFEACEQLLRQDEIKNCSNIIINGLMGMATFTDNQEQISKEFAGLAEFFHKIKKLYFPGDERFKELSMGMSDDYLSAVREGSTMVRIGSKIFGERI